MDNATKRLITLIKLRELMDKNPELNLLAYDSELDRDSKYYEYIHIVFYRNYSEVVSYEANTSQYEMAISYVVKLAKELAKNPDNYYVWILDGILKYYEENEESIKVRVIERAINDKFHSDIAKELINFIERKTGQFVPVIISTN